MVAGRASGVRPHGRFGGLPALRAPWLFSLGRGVHLGAKLSRRAGIVNTVFLSGELRKAKAPGRRTVPRGRLNADTVSLSHSGLTPFRGWRLRLGPLSSRVAGRGQSVKHLQVRGAHAGPAPRAMPPRLLAAPVATAGIFRGVAGYAQESGPQAGLAHAGPDDARAYHTSSSPLR